MRQAIQALVFSAGIATLCACAGKVNIKPEGPFLGSGAYRSRSVSEAGGHGYHLELRPSGRFTLKTYASGCLIDESSGQWNSSPEFLDMEVKEARHREGCTSAWRIAAAEAVFSCPIRKLSDRSFLMIHEEISQGTEWTEWTRLDRAGFAESQERPGQNPDSSLSLNTAE